MRLLHLISSMIISIQIRNLAVDAKSSVINTKIKVGEPVGTVISEKEENVAIMDPFPLASNKSIGHNEEIEKHRYQRNYRNEITEVHNKQEENSIEVNLSDELNVKEMEDTETEYVRKNNLHNSGNGNGIRSTYNNNAEIDTVVISNKNVNLYSQQDGDDNNDEKTSRLHKRIKNGKLIMQRDSILKEEEIANGNVGTTDILCDMNGCHSIEDSDDDYDHTSESSDNQRHHRRKRKDRSGHDSSSDHHSSSKCGNGGKSSKSSGKSSKSKKSSKSSSGKGCIRPTNQPTHTSPVLHLPTHYPTIIDHWPTLSPTRTPNPTTPFTWWPTATGMPTITNMPNPPTPAPTPYYTSTIRQVFSQNYVGSDLDLMNGDQIEGYQVILILQTPNYGPSGGEPAVTTKCGVKSQAPFYSRRLQSQISNHRTLQRAGLSVDFEMTWSSNSADVTNPNYIPAFIDYMNSDVGKETIKAQLTSIGLPVEEVENVNIDNSPGLPPSLPPTLLPTLNPTPLPTPIPSPQTFPPTVSPTKAPTVPPTSSPTLSPTEIPTTPLPTIIPATAAPSVSPTQLLTSSSPTSFTETPSSSSPTSITEPPSSSSPTSITESPSSTSPTSITESPSSTSPTSITESPSSTSPTSITESPSSTSPTSVTEFPSSTSPTSITEYPSSSSPTSITEFPSSSSPTSITESPSSTSPTLVEDPISTTSVSKSFSTSITESPSSSSPTSITGNSTSPTSITGNSTSPTSITGNSTSPTSVTELKPTETHKPTISLDPTITKRPTLSFRPTRTNFPTLFSSPNATNSPVEPTVTNYPSNITRTLFPTLDSTEKPVPSKNPAFNFDPTATHYPTSTLKPTYSPVV